MPAESLKIQVTRLAVQSLSDPGDLIFAIGIIKYKLRASSNPSRKGLTWGC